MPSQKKNVSTRTPKVKTKRSITNEKIKIKDVKCFKISPVHDFSEDEIKKIRSDLVTWYQENKRDLPWRKLALDPDINKRAYSVWVSEIMLQQTQVVTVIDYYNKWIQKWPTLQDLAKATLEEVNEMWSGLGYYSRGRRLHEGAQKVVDELNGEMPRTADELLKVLPGVGRYTAGAVSSIAYNQVTGIVDGNVIRVLARLRLIGADSTNQTTMETFWHHANKLVDENHPGDFNQAMMELGATICSPKTPTCSTCPVKSHCKAFRQVEAFKKNNSSKLVNSNATYKPKAEIPDIECLVNECSMCLNNKEPWDSSLGVCNYPRKGKKKAAREERTSVCIVSRLDNDDNQQYLILKRPQKGLLAGLWEFPSEIITETSPNIAKTLKSKYGIVLSHECKRSKVGEVVHIFSHIHQTYVVECVMVNENCIHDIHTEGMKWVTKQEFLESAISTAMKKIFKAYEKSHETASSIQKGVKRKRGLSEEATETKKQTSLNSFFMKAKK